MHTKLQCSIRNLDFHFCRAWQEAASCQEVAGGVQNQGWRDQAGPRAEGSSHRAGSGANRDFKMASSAEARACLSLALQHSLSVGIERGSAPPVTAQPEGDRSVGSRG